MNRANAADAAGAFDPGCDPYLVEIVDKINRSDEESRLTVMIKGTVIAGTLISFQSWMTLDEEYDDLIDMRELHVDRDASADEGNPRFLHMKAVSLCSGPQVPIGSPQWRCRLSAVDAWSIRSYDLD